MEDYLIKATDPHQYDSENLDWRIDGDVNSPSRVLFRGYLEQNIEDMQGKSVLDIGSGVGHLFNFLLERGVKEIQGIEPSRRNVEASQTIYPNVKVFEGPLSDFKSDKKFDVGICIMVMEHMKDIKESFSLISNLINENGSLYLIVGDKDFHLITRPEVEVDVQPISQEEIATKTIRPNGTMYDIFRSLNMYIEAAQDCEFKLLKQVGIISNLERHKVIRGKPICHLLVFKKDRSKDKNE